VRFAATPAGIGTSRPSSEDRSSARARRPGSSFERRHHRCGTAPGSHRLRWAGTGPGTSEARDGPKLIAGRTVLLPRRTNRRLGVGTRPPRKHRAPPSHTWRGPHHCPAEGEFVPAATRRPGSPVPGDPAPRHAGRLARRGRRTTDSGLSVSSATGNVAVTRGAARRDIQADAGGVGTPELTSPRLHLAPGRQIFPRERTGRVCLAVTVPAVHLRACAR
jgi:hypothetical protein